MPDWQGIVRSQLANAELDPAREAEIVEELAQHLEDRYETLTARGLDDAEAERAVLTELSDAESLVREIETSERPRRGTSAEPLRGTGKVLRDTSSERRYAARTLSILHEVRIAFRALRKTPGLTAVVVLTLAIAIGANTAIFSVVQSVLLKPLPYPHAGRIVRVAATVYPSKAGTSDRGNPFSPRGYWFFVNNNHSFETLVSTETRMPPSIFSAGLALRSERVSAN
ncbi:MAG TPA: permease prefix domain 1-containing protein [Gammaproteobacteria bacterium]|nr:permease prefix domain 1-containing protein [Gammaproteobacteria bacterium]